jgi:hypothetical protein
MHRLKRAKKVARKCGLRFKIFTNLRKVNNDEMGENSQSGHPANGSQQVHQDLQLFRAKVLFSLAMLGN